jgi:hypothetical protein
MSASPFQTHCRIGRVKFKNGAEVTVLSRQPKENTVVRNLMTEVRQVIEDERELRGFVLIGVYNAQKTKSSFEVESTFPMRCLPEFVAETIRRRMWDD